MSDCFEKCQQNLAALADWYSENAGKRNEATTRLHLINTLFIDCLGWEKPEITIEHSHESHYADYVFSAPRHLMVVEAKKEGISFELPAGQSRLKWALGTLRSNYPKLRCALDQVARYCQERGVPIACVANGHQLVAFIATRNDGLAPMKGKALVFGCFESMQQNFLALWQALSKPGILEGKLSRRLLGDATPTLPPKIADGIPGYPGVQQRNGLQTDCQNISDLIIEGIARHRDQESQFLAETYCTSGALSQYALIARRILTTRYSALFDESLPRPDIQPAVSKKGISPELMAESLSLRPILLLGDVGVGKTMFIRHLVATDESGLFQHALSLYLDLGSQGNLSPDLRDFVVRDIIRQLRADHGIDINADKFVRGVYHGELQRFRAGIYGALQEQHPEKYKFREIEYLETLISERDDHLKHSLVHLCKARKEQVVIFLDNADQRTEKTQEAAFLIAQELAAHWPVTVFVALRPETFHRSQRMGALSGYHSRAFTIEPPRVDLVVRRRLVFARRFTTGKYSLEGYPNVSIQAKSLDMLIAAFIRSMDENDDLIKAIDNMSAGNVRIGLDWVRQFFGSGHIDTEKIIGILKDSGRYRVPLHEFLRAVIYGDNRYYDASRSPVTNLFSVSRIDQREHFLVPVCLTVIRRTSGNDGWLDTTLLFDHVQSFGFVPEQINTALQNCTERGLIETSGRQPFVRGLNHPKALRIRTSGVYHLEYLLVLFVYMDAVVVDTPILDKTWRLQLQTADTIKSRLDRAELFLTYLDASWSQCTADNTGFDWAAKSGKCRSDIQRIRRRMDRRSRAAKRAGGWN